MAAADPSRGPGPHRGGALPMPAPDKPQWRRRAGSRLRKSPQLESVVARLKHLRAALGGGGYPLHRNERVAPVFLVGSGRSGNTLLRRMLEASPELHIPPETYVLGTVISLFRRIQNLEWPHQVRLLLAQFEFHPDFAEFEVSLRRLAGELTALERSRRSLAALLDGFYRYHGTATGAEFIRWGDKTPLNAYSLDRIRNVFPEAQFVHLVRDGIDVIHSYVASGLMGDLTTATDRWTTSVDAVRTFMQAHPSSCLEVRYEDLTSDPAAELERVCGFLGIGFDPGFVTARGHVGAMGDVVRHGYHEAVANPVTTDAVGKGRRALAPAELAHVAARLAPVLEQLGYPPPPAAAVD